MRSGTGARSSRWKTPRDARGQVADDGRHDAAGHAGDDEHRLGAQLQAVGLVGHRPFLEGDGEAPVVVVTDLDHSGIAQSLGDEHVGEGGGLAAGSEVHGLHEGIGALPLERLGDADHTAAHGCDRSGIVVAVTAAESGGRDQEGPRCSHGLVEMAQGAEQEFDPDAQGLLPFGQVHLGQRCLGVQGREPVDALDALVASPRVDAPEELVGAGGVVDGQDVGAERFELLDQRSPDPAVVQHDQDAVAVAERDAGLDAEVQLGTEHAGGQTARNGGRGLVVPGEGLGGGSGGGVVGRQWV